ncbi:MAG: 30S ribosomal protein S9 [Candidatus Shapirobacteria bacterium]|nr:30S ribosomal protein S9 [Candidatus Shapirobacteria bacterium]MDD5073904.1 30S ribosomal protein S9 [Candidatus Shapirobacteria bacterium]MDD5481580.1 30S ribosomal protein S9 [Candidatus Shapirobacteria bacterium]
MAKKPIVKTIGSRKRATARVWLYRGKGDMVVNDQPIEEYFPLSLRQGRLEEPFLVTDTRGKYYATIKVAGGGKSAQVEAVIHGLARALDSVDKEKYHSLLKKAGFLTRDPREKERRKPGTARSARAKRQSPKR